MKRRFLALLLAAAALFGAYGYFLTDTFATISVYHWASNGSVSGGPTGLTSTSPNGGSVIYWPNLDGTFDYEIKSTITLSEYYGGGYYYHYLRASTDALGGPAAQGSFYSVEVQSPVYNSTHKIFVATLVVNKRVGGVLTQLASAQIGCPSGVDVRSIIRGNRLEVWVDNILYFSLTDSSLASGQPGVGLRNAGTNSIPVVRLGYMDRTAPPAISTESIAAYPLPNSIDLQWQGLDNSNGIGVGHYLVYRNGQFLQETTTPEFTDGTVAASTTYTYGLISRDYHFNDSPQTTFNVTTPPTAAVEPRRVGVRSTGSYWGASGEQIDVLSGNLSFTLPLVTARSRAGWSATFGPSYNSQNWRKDTAATWKLGRDVGYGFGWRFQLGSITPYWQGPWTIHHYTFTDSTGAEYRLDQPDANQEKWTSKEGIYLTYDRVSNRLHFPDGSFWVMGCTAGGGEQDAGGRYPTVIQDANANQVVIRYLTGRRMAWDNTSARMQYIEDVRATDQGGQYRSYDFTYNADTVPHLTQIDVRMGLSTQYQFSYLANQNLNSPFSPAVAFGTTHFLSSVTETGTNLTHQFQHDAGGSGELTRVTFPYGGYFGWAFQDSGFSGSRTLRSVATRSLSKSGAAPTTYTFTAGTPGDTVRPYTLLDDPGGNGQKAWYFFTSGSAWQIGLLSYFEQRPGAGQAAKRRHD